MKIKILLFLALIVFLTAGCTAAPSSPPTVYLEVNGDKVPGYQGAYCWDGGLSGTLCVDPLPPSFEEQTPVEVERLLRFQLDRPLPQSLNVSLSPELFGDTVDAETLEVNAAAEWRPDAPAGVYVLNVDARWEQGDVTYWFYILIP